MKNNNDRMNEDTIAKKEIEEFRFRPLVRDDVSGGDFKILGVGRNKDMMNSISRIRSAGRWTSNGQDNLRTR